MKSNSIDFPFALLPFIFQINFMRSFVQNILLNCWNKFVILGLCEEIQGFLGYELSNFD